MINKELAAKLKDAGYPQQGSGLEVDGYLLPTIADLLQQLPGYKLSHAEIEDDEWIWQVWSPGLRLVFVGLDPDTMLAEYWLAKKDREKCKERYSTLTT